MSPSKDESKSKEKMKEIGWFALKTVGISAAVLGGVAVAVPAIGFTAGGVAAGSLAAAYQSAFLGGTIASGSGFAILQSVGAAGLAAITKAAVVAASASVVGAHTAAKVYFKNKKNEGEPDPPPDSSFSCEKKSDVPPGNSLPCELPSNNPYVISQDQSDDEEKQEDVTEDECKVIEKGSEAGKYAKISGSFEVNEKKVEENNTTKNVLFSKQNASPRNEMEIHSLESKWNEVKLSDDVSLSKQLSKKNKIKLC